MSDFVVSARKYRPATFDTVVGQVSITTTLKNAIKNKHLAQAFLFCGPRGVGKTTCARILAKTLNCFNITANIEACDQCESCRSFNEGHSLNIYELDAASNNSVDDIRSLIEQVRFAPQLGTHKVYIIDEVHMLSQSAFNAFLKTLEEPPKHTIFILATTEKHKILPTILSRCQIFDFNRIQIEDIATHLAYIAKNEGVTAETDALHIIAQKADGALRDACSIFDQIVSFAGNNVTYKAAIDNLNILDYDYYFKITDALLENNISASLLLFNEILNNGFDGHNFITSLAGHFRNLLVCKDEATLQLLEVGANIKDKYKAQSGKCPQSFLLKALSLSSKADINYKTSRNPRLLVELTLMQLCSLQQITTGDVEKKNSIILPASQPTPVTETTNTPATNNAAPLSTTNAANMATSTPLPSATIPVPATPPIKRTIVNSLPSINAAKKNQPNTADPNTQEQQAATNYSELKNEFTQEQLEVAWYEYALQIKEKGMANFFATLSNRKPQLKDKFLIEFGIDNKVQEESLHIEKVELMGYLRKKLNNYELQLKTIITKNEEGKKLYTTTDKFEHMAGKNPAINLLKKWD
jgi:DNA polymerase III subunit gamma/tau